MINKTTHDTFRLFTTFVILLLISAQAAVAQIISNDDITSKLDIDNEEISLSLPVERIPEGSTCTWKVDDKEVTDGFSNGKLTITLQLSNKSRKVEVSITSADNKTQTLSETIEPLVYGNEYDGTPYYAESYESGDGSKDKPFLISNDMQLAKLAHDVNNGKSFSGKYFKLTKDIDLGKALWTPIGVTDPSTKRFFNGKFDGDGHTISNMHIVWTYDSGNEISLGLFSRLSGANNNETSFATVTNLIINNACIEKKVGHTPTVTGTIKMGILAADLTQNAEISNIIISNSIITDNEEAYTLKNKLRIGGIVGYLDAYKSFRIYNISADTKINMLSAATLNGVDKQASVSGGIGAASNLQTQGTVLPTNIYVHSTQIKTNANSAKCIRGSVVSFIGNDNFSNSVKGTWYFTPDNKVSGTNTYNYGTEKELNSYGKTFTEIANTYIN